MSGPDRRTFLKRAGAAAVGGSLAAGACAPGADQQDPATGARPDLDGPLLDAVAARVLPADSLGPEGVARAAEGFRVWVREYRPVAELDHPYLTDRLRYAPADPAPRWQADLQALDLEARRRLGAPFTELDAGGQDRLLLRALDAEPGPGFPPPARARHVATGLMAWFYASSEANDLCYGVRIGRHTCRGIDDLPAEPASLDQGDE